MTAKISSCDISCATVLKMVQTNHIIWSWIGRMRHKASTDLPQWRRGAPATSGAEAVQVASGPKPSRADHSSQSRRIPLQKEDFIVLELNVSDPVSGGSPATASDLIGNDQAGQLICQEVIARVCANNRRDFKRIGVAAI